MAPKAFASKQDMIDAFNSFPRRSTKDPEGVQKEVKTGLTFWEEELLENDRRRQMNFVAEPTTNNEETQNHTAKHETCIQSKSQERSEPYPITQPSAEPEDTAGMNVGRIVYLPKGHYSADADIDGDEYESDTEPMSSSHELVGRFCQWPFVAKFCYKYMDDEGGHVSKRFFSREQIFQRNWSM